MKKSALLILMALIFPNVALACVGSGSIFFIILYLASQVFLMMTLLFLIAVIIKSVRAKKIYRGKLNVFLLVFFIIFILTFAGGGYKQYLEDKENRKCQERCIDGEPCFCNPLCG